jgi:uncharacterized protein YcaQ
MTGTQASQTIVDQEMARRMAVRAALLAGPRLPATEEGILKVARHFGGIQIDPTRTVERTQYLVLWSRLGKFDRALLDQLFAARRLFEWNAFIVPVERLPELLYYGKQWPGVGGEWRERANRFMAGNTEFRQSILDQLRAEGPLQSRQIDVSKVRVGWESTGWTHGKNASQMLEFMSVKMDVVVAGRVGQERLWDLAERVIPANTPRDELTEGEYQELRVMRAVARFGVGTFKEIRDRVYGLTIPAAKALFGRLVEEGRLTDVTLRLPSGDLPGYADPAALARASAKGTLTTLMSPFDPLVYDRERTARLFDFRYRLEMYVPKGERKFGHFVLPIVHGTQLVGRLDSERDRKTNELIVRQVHWEEKAPSAATRNAVDQAIADLSEFVGAG